MTVIDWLITFGSSATIGAAAATGVVWLLRQLITTRLTHSVAHEFDKRFASFQSELARQQSRETAILSTALGAVNSAQGTIQAARLRASTRLWVTVLQIRDCNTVLSRLDILTVQELSDAGRTQKRYLDTIAGSDPLVTNVLPELKKYQRIETVRPFVSDLAWAYFFAYRAFTFRIVYLVQQYAEKHQFVSPYADGGLDQIIRSVLSKSELELVSQKNVGRLHFIRTLIESKILHEIQEAIAGRHASEEALKHAQHITAAVEKAGIPPLGP